MYAGSFYHGQVPSSLTVSPINGLRTLRQRLLHPTQRWMRGVALASIVANVAIVMSGATVRLTESGLGCPTWPSCTGDSLVPVPAPGTPTIHMVIEFGNRLVTTPVTVIAVLCVLAAWRLRPRRRGLLTLALLQLAGVGSQALMGGIVVLTELRPSVVTAHYLISAALIAATVALYIRAGEGDEPPQPVVRREIRILGWALVPVVAVLLLLGTIVTGTGPHGGDATSPRFPFAIQQVTQLHADVVWITVGLTFALLLGLRLTNAPAAATRRAAELLVLELAQGAVGYLQYFLGVPPVLVWLHILGSTLVWIATLRVAFALRDRGPAVPTDVEVPQATNSAPVNA